VTNRGPLRVLRRILLVLIGVLFVLSIPWYRRGGEEAELWLGLPDWVTVALLCYAGAALLNAIAWLLTDVPDDDAPRETPR
jgi:hypothetical protein